MVLDQAVGMDPKVLAMFSALITSCLLTSYACAKEVHVAG